MSGEKSQFFVSFFQSHTKHFLGENHTVNTTRLLTY